MALPSSFWLPLAGLLIVAPQPSSADTFFAFAGGSVGFGADPERCAVREATSATCDRTNTATDPDTGETKSGEIHIGADLASGDLFARAESAASRPTAQAVAEAQIGDTLTFAGAISHGSTTTITMTGSMSDSNAGGGSNSFTGGALEIFDDTGLLTSGGACSRPTGDFICDPTNDQTQVSVISDSFSISSTVNISLHSKILVEFVVFASTFLNGSADISDPITIDLPPGVTFTSASGKFLTSAGTGGVPEPSTWTMMLAGFAGLAALGWRTRRRTAASSCDGSRGTSKTATDGLLDLSTC